ncbi:MAG TPA: RHS repeat-associated core domain-containing protein [Phycisphaerae bacterium]|nr:RHS repeat-associated core domain-containing protein [Phycisphaerae bacterium]
MRIKANILMLIGFVLLVLAGGPRQAAALPCMAASDAGYGGELGASGSWGKVVEGARLHDEESGLVYNRARMLNPTLGRFMQKDPLGYIDGENDLAFCGDDPLRFVDPNGQARGNPPPRCRPGDGCASHLKNLIGNAEYLAIRLADWAVDMRDFQGKRDPNNFNWQQWKAHLDLIAQYAKQTLQCAALADKECQPPNCPGTDPSPNLTPFQIAKIVAEAEARRALLDATKAIQDATDDAWDNLSNPKNWQFPWPLPGPDPRRRPDPRHPYGW